jgi:hypothetical protein
MKENICEYGCGKKATHVLKNGKNCCSSHTTKCDAIKLKNGAGLKKAYKEKRKETPFLKLTNEERSSNGKIGAIKRDEYFEDISFNFRSLNYIKKFIFDEQEGKCNKCKLNEWLGQDICLELEHIDGDNNNNERSNLELLCPNCHSQTETWRGKNKNSGSKIVSDEDIIEAFKTHKNIRRTLIAVGLAAKGGNYNRVKKLIV